MILEGLRAFLVSHSSTIITIAIILLATWFGLHLVGQGKRQLNKKLDAMDLDGGRRARLKTLVVAASYTGRILILVIGAISLLEALNVDVAPLIASLGVAGLALSLGTQTLVKDYVGGIIILIENMYVVGDEVQIGAVAGTVEVFDLRSTQVRETTGRLTIVPNGDVRVITNISREWSQAMVDLNLPFDTDLGSVVRTLEGAMQQVAQDGEIQADLQSPPSILGWNSQTDWSVQVRLSTRTRVGRKGAVESKMRRYALEALNQAGIRLAQPGMNIYSSNRKVISP